MKRLYRSRTDRMLFGVAGGLAKYFEVDVVLVRLLWVLAVLSGPGVAAYIIAAIIIPEEPKAGYPPAGCQPRGGAPAQPAEPGSAGLQSEPRDAAAGDQDPAGGRPRTEGAADGGGRSSRLFGLVLILLGTYFLMHALLPGWWWTQFWWVRLDHLWPLTLVAIGVAIILRRHPR